MRSNRWVTSGAPALAFLAVFSGCCGGKRTEAARDASPKAGAEAPPPGDSEVWSVRLGAAGGFTGGGSGSIVWSDGRVQTWSQVVPGEAIETQEAGRVEPEALRALRETMTAPDLVALVHTDAGNMTGFLEWREGTAFRTWTWKEMAREPALPAPLARARDAALAAVRAAQR